MTGFDDVTLDSACCTDGMSAKGPIQEIQDVTVRNRGEKSPMMFSLKDYDALFSHFDPRPYIIRSISDDFISEAKKASKGTKSQIVIFIPKNKRSLQTEEVVTRKLFEHFKRHAKKEKEGFLKIINNGLIYIILGTLLMIVRSIFEFQKYSYHSFGSYFFAIYLEAPSWFLIWEGLRLIVFKSRAKFTNALFYWKMKNSSIDFQSSE